MNADRTARITARLSLALAAALLATQAAAQATAPALPADQVPAAEAVAPEAPAPETPSLQTSATGTAEAPAALPSAPMPSAPAAVAQAPADPSAAPLPQADPPVVPGAASDAQASSVDVAPTAPGAPLVPAVTAPTHDALSPWGMFLAADMVVKGVMIGLALASLVTWTIGLAKILEGAVARLRLRRGLKAVLAAPQLSTLAATFGPRGGVAGLMTRAAQHEVEASAEAIDGSGADGLLNRVASSLSRIEARAGRRLAIGTGILATIGATAPFVGLFGTVWGIMNSFIGIAESHTTNLAVVAPGIAEALLATAMGLVAAIPAVIIYNHFARSITGYKALLADTAAGVERLVSRDLDLRRLSVPALRRAAE